MRFSILDLLILAILAYSIVRSTTRGFIREIYIVSAVLVGAVLSAWFYRPVGNLFKDVVRTENLALFLGFSVIFVGTLVLGAVITWLATRFMKSRKIAVGGPAARGGVRFH